MGGMVKCPECGDTDKILLIAEIAIGRNAKNKNYYRCNNCKRDFKIDDADYEVVK